jgi:hypothetical protein
MACKAASAIAADHQARAQGEKSDFPSALSSRLAIAVWDGNGYFFHLPGLRRFLCPDFEKS